MNRYPSVHLSAIASLIIHSIIFALIIYAMKKQTPAFNNPVYTVNLVSVKKQSVNNLPLMGLPKAAKEEAERIPEIKKETHHKEEKPDKTRLTEDTGEERAKEKAKAEKAAKEKAAKEEAEAKKIEKKKAAKEKAEEVGREKAAKEKVAKEKADKEKADKEKAQAEKTAKEKVAKEKTAKEKSLQEKESVEDTISVLKNKKKIERLAALRSMVNVSKSNLPEGQTPAGSPQGGTQGFGDAISDQYYGMVVASIRKNWVFPGELKDGIMAVVSFTIRRDGTVEGLKLEKSSGNPLYDRSVQNAVKRAVPLPVPPVDRMEVGVNFYP
ncbi:MAG: cell envelope integrity protein TolA [Nitrospirae bacterium]|nr:cell envelope integrity protein TolA [Nitrospirota bacterium]